MEFRSIAIRKFTRLNFFEPLTIKFEGAAIFSDSAYDILGYPRRDFRFYFQGNFNLSIYSFLLPDEY